MLSRAKNMDKNIGKNISKNFSGDKYYQKLIDQAKLSATGALKPISRKEIQKTAEAFDDLIDNRIMKVSKNSLQQNSDTNTNWK